MKRWLIVLIPLILLGGLIVQKLGAKRAEAASQITQKEKRAKAPKSVAIAPVVMRDIVRTFEGVGSVESPLNVEIAPKVTGRIDFLQVREGDPVTQGQVLARIDDSQIQAEVHQQQANVAEAASRLSQAQITQSPTLTAVGTEIRRQQAAVASAKANYNEARQTYNAQVASAEADVTDAQSRINSANADIANAQAVIQSAEANLENGKTKLSRLETLLTKGYVSKEETEDARAQVKVLQGNLAVANGQLGQAQAALASAQAQKQSAQKKAEIVAAQGRANIAAAKAEVQQAQAALVAANSNTAQKSAYAQNLSALRSVLTAAQAQLRSAQAQLGDTVLRSPINGFVTDRLMDPGAITGPGQPILKVQTVRQVWLTVPVPEEVLTKTHPGQTAEVSFDALPGRKFTSRVSRINPAADPLSRQFTVRFTLDNPEDLIKPGMFGRVTMVTDRVKDAVVVPREAIQKGKGGPTVTVVNAKEETEKRSVVLGAEDPEGIQVTQGVQPGEKVVVLTAMPLKEGQTVSTGGKSRGKGRKAGSGPG
jgi:HlyD family secretion protein